MVHCTNNYISNSPVLSTIYNKFHHMLTYSQILSWKNANHVQKCHVRYCRISLVELCDLTLNFSIFLSKQKKVSSHRLCNQKRHPNCFSHLGAHGKEQHVQTNCKFGCQIRIPRPFVSVQWKSQEVNWNFQLFWTPPLRPNFSPSNQFTCTRGTILRVQ